MGKISVYQVVLDNPEGVYKEGDTITGRVVVEVCQSEIRIKGILLRFTGKAIVCWAERASSANFKHGQPPKYIYQNEEEYFDEEFDLLSKDEEDHALKPKRHTFPFDVKLPQQIPPSFESPLGRIRYQITAKICLSRGMNKKVTRPFTVISELDLNGMIDSRKPKQSIKVKSKGFLCLKSGPIRARLRIDKTGYVPGEVIHITGEVTNENSYVSSTTVELLQKTYLRTSEKVNRALYKIDGLQKGEIFSGESCDWTGHVLHVPAIPPSYMKGCRCIDVRYILRLLVNSEFYGQKKQLEAQLEIIIGTMPLKDNFSIAPQQSPYLHQASPSSLPDIPPPTYAESVFGVIKMDAVDDDGGDEEPESPVHSFTPLYAIYDWRRFIHSSEAAKKLQS